MKHTKLVALFMAIVMTMGLMTTAASACTADKDGNITPCEQVEEDGYCDIAVIKGIDWEAGVMYQWNNPYYKGSNDHSTSAPIKGYTDDSELPKGIIDGDTYDPENVDTQSPTETEKPVETEKQYFDDVAPDAWYYDAVNTMAANGIINGYDDGLFHPENYVTTGELCAIIYRLAKNENPVGKPVPGRPECTHWAAYAVYTLYKAGIGYTQASPLQADETANRGEAVYAIMALLQDAKLIDSYGVSHSDKYAQVLNYTAEDNGISDWDVVNCEIASRPVGHFWSTDRILYAYNYGIVHGKDSTGRFDPLGGLTRAELCQMLANAGLTQYTPAEIRPVGGYIG